MAEISLRHVNKIYNGKVHAIHDLSLEIKDNDFVVLVGPSGCGKSTILRMIAGLEEVSFGELFLDGELMNEEPPRERRIAMVFQNYALFPHMTVYENIAFGLRLAKLDREEIARRVKEAAAILGIDNLLTRKPAQLSGGQKQRVALGRAIVCKPRIFLLDEPLSNLDAKLRASMRVELIKLYNRLKTTFVYVTHDQTEALTMGTKIVVLKDGVLQQADSPSQIYDYPANRFVASFMGSPQMNFFEVTIEGEENAPRLRFAGGDELPLPEEVAKRLDLRRCLGASVVLGIRPEHLALAGEGEASFGAVTDYAEPLGSSLILGLRVEGAIGQTAAIAGGRQTFDLDTPVRLTTDLRLAHLFDRETGEALLDVPRRNLFRGTLCEEDGKLRIGFLGTSVLTDRLDCLLDESAAGGGEITIALPAKEPFLEGGEGRFVLRGTVSHLFRQHTRTLVYVTTEGTGERLVFSCAGAAPYAEGGTYDFYFSEREIEPLNAEGAPLLARRPVRGRFRTLSTKKFDLRGGERILEEEFVGDGWLLYCGDPEHYFVVKVPKDYPVYFRERVRLADGAPS